MFVRAGISTGALKHRLHFPRFFCDWGMPDDNPPNVEREREQLQKDLVALQVQLARHQEENA